MTLIQGAAMKTRKQIQSRLGAELAALILFPAGSSSPANAAWNCSDKAKHTLENTTPVNLGQFKLQLRDYRYCGGDDADFAAKIAEAKPYLQDHALEVARPALVLDIDETSLSNWLEIDQDDFAFMPSGQCSLQLGTTSGDQEWELSARAEALMPTLDLFNTAKSLGVTVFFITGRPDRFDLRAATVKNLKEAGYDGWQDLVMRPISSAGSVADYKSSARKAIQDKKYHIILNVGDQQSDVDGGFADQTFRVPNPFYFIP